MDIAQSVMLENFKEVTKDEFYAAPWYYQDTISSLINKSIGDFDHYFVFETGYRQQVVVAYCFWSHTVGKRYFLRKK